MHNFPKHFPISVPSCRLFTLRFALSVSLWAISAVGASASGSFSDDGTPYVVDVSRIQPTAMGNIATSIQSWEDNSYFVDQTLSLLRAIASATNSVGGSDFDASRLESLLEQLVNGFAYTSGDTFYSAMGYDSTRNSVHGDFSGLSNLLASAFSFAHTNFGWQFTDDISMTPKPEFSQNFSLPEALSYFEFIPRNARNAGKGMGQGALVNWFLDDSGDTHYSSAYDFFGGNAPTDLKLLGHRYPSGYRLFDPSQLHPGVAWETETLPAESMQLALLASMRDSLALLSYKQLDAITNSALIATSNLVLDATEDPDIIVQMFGEIDTAYTNAASALLAQGDTTISSIAGFTNFLPRALLDTILVVDPEIQVLPPDDESGFEGFTLSLDPFGDDDDARQLFSNVLYYCYTIMFYGALCLLVVREWNYYASLGDHTS